jgi:hypothetical protein
MSLYHMVKASCFDVAQDDSDMRSIMRAMFLTADCVATVIFVALSDHVGLMGDIGSLLSLQCFFSIKALLTLSLGTGL